MKKSIRKVFAFLLAAGLVLSNGNFTSFAAVETDGLEVDSRKAGKIALYQAGDLSAAYVEGEQDGLAGLSEEDQAIADAIYKGLKNFQKDIDLYELGMRIPSSREADIIEIYQQVINSHPELFYVSTALEWFHYGINGQHINFGGFSPQYITDDKSELAQMKEDFNRAADKACEGVDKNMTDLEKALYLHDYIIKHNAYDYENFSQGDDHVPNMSHSAYGVLVEGTSVCDGYALAYSYLLQKCGINARLITSDEMAHAWSAIELDGSWYFVDLTNDDAVFRYGDGTTGDCYDYVGHRAFLASEALWKNTPYSGGNYRGWAQTDIQCNNTQYDNAIWKTQTNEYGYCDDFWYYLDSNTYQIMKTDDPTQAGDVYFSFTEPEGLDGSWPAYENGEIAGYWPGIYTKVSVYAPQHVLFFNLSDCICYINLTLDPSDEGFGFTPFIPYKEETFGVGAFYGVKVLDDFLTISAAASPNDREKVYLAGYLAALEEITFDQEEMPVYVGHSRKALKPILDPADYLAQEDGSWSSADPTIASIDPVTGEITGVAVGSTTITYTLDGVEGSFTVNVKEVSDVKKGDANGDGEVTATDALLIMQCDVGLINEDEIDAIAADVDGQNGITATDAQLVLQVDVGLINFDET